MNINSINVNKYPVSQVFDPDSKVIFEIPKYQREYTWGSREWESLFDDLTENDDGYFLGSIICINSATDTINAPKFEVVDGQQRLTTLSLFLAALLLGLDSDTFYIYHVAAVMVDNLRRLLLGINLSDKAVMDFDFPGVGFPV